MFSACFNQDIPQNKKRRIPLHFKEDAAFLDGAPCSMK